MPSWSAVRTDRYLYARWYERERPLDQREYELYDLHTDPYQLTDLIKTPEGRAAHADRVAILDRRLAARTGCAGVMTCR
ncbi:hypothetical protein AB0M34_15245 [Nocardia sp. NPDC050193]